MSFGEGIEAVRPLSGVLPLSGSRHRAQALDLAARVHGPSGRANEVLKTAEKFDAWLQGKQTWEDRAEANALSLECNRLEGERDRARDTAVRLEQEIARLEIENKGLTGMMSTLAKRAEDLEKVVSEARDELKEFQNHLVGGIILDLGRARERVTTIGANRELSEVITQIRERYSSTSAVRKETK